MGLCDVCVWLTSFDITISSFSCVVTNDMIASFLQMTTFHCICVPDFLYTLISGWTLRSALFLGFCE